MNLDFFVSLVAFFVGAGLVLGLVALIFRPLFQSFRGGRAIMRLGRANRELERAAAELERGNLAGTLLALRRAALIDVFESEELIRALCDQQQNFLSRALLVAEELSLHIDNLGELEQLFAERAELAILRERLLLSNSRLSEKRERKGKDTPLWRKEEFERKLSEVELDLRNNRARLERALEKLFSQLSRGPARESVTYH